MGCAVEGLPADNMLWWPLADDALAGTVSSPPIGPAASKLAGVGLSMLVLVGGAVNRLAW